MPPAIVDTMTGFRASILRREAEQMARMALAWRNVEQALLGEMELVAADVLERRAAGRALDMRALMRMERYQTLLRDTRIQLLQYGEMAEREITQAQRVLAELGIDHAGTMMRMAAGSVDLRFDQLVVAAVENMVGLAGDGSPLASLLRDSFGDGMTSMTDELIRSTALGRNPRLTAQRMRQGVRIALNRSLNLARTEQLRVYREASRQQYEASGVVSGFKRIATKDSRTCMACLLRDGELYTVQETLRTHPSCRCAMIPIVKGYKPVTWQKGADWFRQQDAATQRQMMGPGKYAAWQAGQFDLDQLVTVRPNPVWGDSVQVTPLRELTGE